MTTPESTDNTILVLYPPRVLSATQPVEGANIGVPLVIYDLVIDGKGATVQVDPPLSGTVDPGDVIELWLEGEVAYLDYEIIVDENAITTLRIPRGRLHPDRLNTIFYTIRRGSQSIGNSLSLTLLYNKIRPGLKDRFPEIDGHSELALLLPDAIKNGVDADFVSAQVCVSYPYCRAYDTITLKCNGEIMTYKVGPDEAPQPPNPGSPNPITVCFTVTRAYLESAVRPGGKLDFSCTCTDQLGNTPDTDAVWSATQTVDEDLAGLLLPAALLREQLNDPDDDLSLIDLEKLRGNPLLLIILTADSRFQPGYTLNALYTAILTGQPDVVVRVSGTVEADEFGQKKIVVLEVPNDKVPARYTVTVTYELFNGTTWLGRSKTATALVVGESTIEIDPPTLVPPATIPVDPLENAQGVNVRVNFAEAQPGDKAQLKLVNPLPGSPEFPELSLDQTFAIFTLDVVFLGLWHGKVPQLRWDLIRGGEVIAQSSALVLTVLPILSDDDRLPTPTLAGKTGLELDVLKLTTQDLFELKEWPLQALGQVVWLRYDGFLNDGTATPLVIWGGLPHNYPPSDLATPLTAAMIAWLKTLKDGSKVTVTFEVNFDKVRYEVKKVRFPVRRYTVKALVELQPEISLVTNSRGENIPNGSITTDTSITFSGTASKAQQIQLYNNLSPVGPVVDVKADCSWSQLVSGLAVAEYSFTAKALYGDGTSSEARTLTVEAVVTPTISSVKGSPSGVEIPHGTDTVETSVVLTGTASKGQKVDILDGSVSKGQPVADETTGIWTLLVSGLDLVTHSFSAKARYGQNPESNTWEIRVREWPLTLSGISGSRHGSVEVFYPIPNGGTWTGRYITISGTGAPADFLTPVINVSGTPGNVNVTNQGAWSTATFHGVGLVGRTFTIYYVSSRTGHKTNSWTITWNDGP